MQRFPCRRLCLTAPLPHCGVHSYLRLSRALASTLRGQSSAPGESKQSRSSVTFMPPPPPPPGSTPSPSHATPSGTPSPLADTRRPIRDRWELIVALVHVFAEYSQSLQSLDTQAKPSAAYASPSSGHFVPFYPPVPLRYMEQHCQSLLCRLLPGGNAGNAVSLCGDEDEMAKRNRQVLLSRVQSSGVFVVSPSTRASGRIRLQETGKSTSDHKKEDGDFVLRVKPGVRELALLIANFLASLEPNVSPGVQRKSVPMAVVRQVPLNPSAAAFVRHDLSNDVRWLLLVYERDTFELTKKGTLVRLKDIPPQASHSASTYETSKSGCTGSSNKPHVVSTATDPAIKTSCTEVQARVKDFKDVDTEADTVVHMGKRFIAPAAMERYRLSQRLKPLLEFIPCASTLSSEACCSDNKNGVSNDAHNDSDDNDEEFVDFSAVRTRAVTRYPHLAEVLSLTREELEWQRETLLLSALKSIGVDWRWGRRAQPVASQPLKQQNPFEMGLLFVRRRHRRQEEEFRRTDDKGDTSQRKHSCNVREVQSMIEAEEEVVERTHSTYLSLLSSSQPAWWALSCAVVTSDTFEKEISNENVTDANSEADRVRAVDTWEEWAISVTQAVTYDALLRSRPTVSPHTSSAPLHEAMYPAGACANSAFVRHLLRSFTPRHYENVHSTLLLAAQGTVPPLMRHEVMDTIACLFYPYGHAGQGTGSPASSSPPAVFNRYVEGFFAAPLPAHPCRLCIRPRVLPGDVPLSLRRLLPARLVLEILCKLYCELRRRAEEIGLAMDEDEGEEDEDEESYLTFLALRDALHPASRAYIRDVLGDLSLIPLLAACHARLFRVRPMSWTVIGLTREGQRTARERMHERQREEERAEENERDSSESQLYRSRRTGCLFTDDTRQQLEAFVIIR